MKNPKKFWIIALLAVIMLPLMSCSITSSVSTKQRYEGRTFDISIPAKDFQVIGLVHVETSVDKDGNGTYITYDALLKAAEAIGGNGIANVMIDRKTTTTIMKSIGSGVATNEQTWYGSALAIKYTNALAPDTPLSTNSWVIGGK